MNMKIDNKYLGIFSIIFLICTVFILYDYRPNPLQEDFETISTNAGPRPQDYSVGGYGTSNAVIPGTAISTNMDPSQLNRVPMSSTSGFSVTDYKDVSNKDGSVTTSMDVISQGSTECDPNTTYSMKNVMQDNNGNVIIRYMDTCGKYYTYQYNQTINKVQNIVTPPPPANIPPTAPPETLPPTTQPPVISSSTISDIVSKSLNEPRQVYPTS